jgi:hypothetical protein
MALARREDVQTYLDNLYRTRRQDDRWATLEAALFRRMGARRDVFGALQEHLRELADSAPAPRRKPARVIEMIDYVLQARRPMAKAIRVAWPLCLGLLTAACGFV